MGLGKRCLVQTIWSCCLYVFWYYHIPLYSLVYIFIGVYMVAFLFNTVIYVFLLLYLCILIVCLRIFIVPAGTLRLPWLRFFRPFFLSCKTNARVKLAKTGHGQHSYKNFVLFYVFFAFCRSVYCLCVNVYCTTATGWQPNCSLTNIAKYIKYLFQGIKLVNQNVKQIARFWNSHPFTNCFMTHFIFNIPSTHASSKWSLLWSFLEFALLVFPWTSDFWSSKCSEYWK